MGVSGLGNLINKIEAKKLRARSAKEDAANTDIEGQIAIASLHLGFIQQILWGNQNFYIIEND